MELTNKRISYDLSSTIDDYTIKGEVELNDNSIININGKVFDQGSNEVASIMLFKNEANYTLSITSDNEEIIKIISINFAEFRSNIEQLIIK